MLTTLQPMDYRHGCCQILSGSLYFLTQSGIGAEINASIGFKTRLLFVMRRASLMQRRSLISPHGGHEPTEKSTTGSTQEGLKTSLSGACLNIAYLPGCRFGTMVFRGAKSM